MLKTKKGLVVSQVFIYSLSLIIIAIILLMGYKYFSDTKEIMDETELLRLKKDITNDIESISSDFESQKKVSYSVPASIDLCLVDLGQINPDDLEDYPLIKDSVTGVDKNAFIIGQEIFESFYVGNIEINAPHFKCFNSSAGKINFTIEGLGNGALI